MPTATATGRRMRCPAVVPCVAKWVCRRARRRAAAAEWPQSTAAERTRTLQGIGGSPRRAAPMQPHVHHRSCRRASPGPVRPPRPAGLRASRPSRKTHRRVHQAVPLLPRGAGCGRPAAGPCCSPWAGAGAAAATAAPGAAKWSGFAQAASPRRRAGALGGSGRAVQRGGDEFSRGRAAASEQKQDECGGAWRRCARIGGTAWLTAPPQTFAPPAPQEAPGWALPHHRIPWLRVRQCRARRPWISAVAPSIPAIGSGQGVPRRLGTAGAAPTPRAGDSPGTRRRALVQSRQARTKGKLALSRASLGTGDDVAAAALPPQLNPLQMVGVGRSTGIQRLQQVWRWRRAAPPLAAMPKACPPQAPPGSPRLSATRAAPSGIADAAVRPRNSQRAEERGHGAGVGGRPQRQAAVPYRFPNTKLEVLGGRQRAPEPPHRSALCVAPTRRTPRPPLNSLLTVCPRRTASSTAEWLLGGWATSRCRRPRAPSFSRSADSVRTMPVATHGLSP